MLNPMKKIWLLFTTSNSRIVIPAVYILVFKLLFIKNKCIKLVQHFKRYIKQIK